MESEVNYSRVGMFLFLGIVLVLGTLLWLSKYYSEGSQDQYVIYFGNYSLDGLQKDSVVSMKGIRVGSVKDYEISPDDIQKVKVLISLDEGIPVKSDTRAVLRRNLLTGLAKIDLVGGTQESPKLVSKQGIPEIKEDITDLDRIADSVPDLIEKLDGIAARLTLVLSDENLNHFSSTLNSLSDFSSNLSKGSEPLVGTLKNIEEISARLSNIISEVEKVSVEGEDSKGIAKTVNASLQDIEALLGDLKMLTSELGPVVRGVSRAGNSISRDMEVIADSVSKLSSRYGDPGDIFKKEDREAK